MSDIEEMLSRCTTNTRQVEQPTVGSMLEAVEQLRRDFPDIPECWHERLITRSYFPQSAKGTWYACAECFKPFLVPEHLLMTKAMDERIASAQRSN